MSKFVFPVVMVFFVIYISWKIYSVYNENKKLKISFDTLKNKNKARSDIFSLTEEIGDLQLDSDNKLFKFKGQIQFFKFDELVNFYLSLNEKIINIPPSENIDLNLLDSLTDVDEIKNLDIIFYTKGLNEGQYSYQFIYEPLYPYSDEYTNLLENVNKTISFFYQLLKNQ